MAFGVWDYVVLITTLLISSGIGVYARFSGGRQKTADEYLLGGRSMPILPVAFSLMASFISSITLLGVSNEIYTYGTQFIIINLSYGLATPIIAYLYLPVFYKLNATSAYEYLERRFGKATRISASLSYSLQMIMYMGIVLYAPAIAVEALTGLNKNWSILLVGTVCVFYSTIGGMKAVVFTDVFQSILMYGAVLAIVISGTIYAGGFSEIFRAADEGNRLELWNFNPDPTIRHSWISILIGSIATYLTLYAVSQGQVQRLLTVKDLRSAQIAVWLSWPILSLLSLSTALSGLVIYYYYRKCDPFEQGRITSRDQNMPLYVMDALGHLPGISGLFVAGIFSGALSSVSATLNSLSAVSLEDYFKPLYLHVKKTPYTSSSFVTKVLVFVYGLVCIGGAYLAQFLGGILEAALILFGVVGGPLLGLFTLGMCTEVANQSGVIPALFIGIGLSTWLGFAPKPPADRQLEFSTEGCSEFGGMFKNTTSTFVEDDEEKSFFYLYRISYMYAAFIGFLITFILGYVLSSILKLLKKQGKERIYLNRSQTLMNPDLFMPPKAKRIRRRNLIFQEKLSKIENENF